VCKIGTRIWGISPHSAMKRHCRFTNTVDYVVLTLLLVQVILLLVILTTKIVSRCQTTLWVNALVWGIGGSVWLQTAGPKSFIQARGLPLIALHCLLLMLVSVLLRVVNRHCSGFPVSGRIEISGPLTL